MKYCLLIILALMGCGQAPAPAPVTVDPILAPYLAKFETDIGVSTAGISANFADTETLANPLGETVGECVVDGDNRQILVDSKYWSIFNEDDKLELMYHELGHCAMNMQHIFTKDDNGCPTSIMYPVVFGSTFCFADNMSKYFEELISHK